MLQVPCLSPPIYGHSHYKKFWLRQTELKESSIGGSAGVACEIMKSSTTTSSPDTSSSKRISGKRRPQMRSSSSSVMKVALNESPVSVSPTSSGEDFPIRKASNRRSLSDGDGANSSPLSTVENRDEDPAEGNTPKSFIRSIDNEEYDDEEEDKFLMPQLNVCQTAEEQLEDEEMKNNEDSKLLLVRHNMSCDDVSHSSDNQTRAAQAGGSMDCQTSKCKGIDTDSRQEDNGQEDSDNENENEEQTSSDSDSATSSTSQASDHDDARSHSEKSSFRQYMKRQAKISKTGDKSGSSPSPKARQSSIATVAAAASISISAAGVDNPVSPSGRLGSSSPGINSHNNVSTRTCKHCGTMKTPLWRNGPLGPKSLCNACGIRLRKARRNNNHEGNGPAPSLSAKRKQGDQATMIGDRHQYSKKSRLAFSREKREMASIMRLLPHEHQRLGGSSPSSHHTSKLFGKSVSKDEEEGAVLLMALSCGLVLA